MAKFFVSSIYNEENLLKKAFVLKERMPNYNIYLDTCFTIGVDGRAISPIF